MIPGVEEENIGYLISSLLTRVGSIDGIPGTPSH